MLLLLIALVQAYQLEGVVLSEKNERSLQSFRSMFTLRADMASYEDIENTIISGAKLQGTNACVLMLAILVASVGLNTNSTAVIIGAMLISPLMGSIIAIGYGFATNDLSLAKFSALRLSIQVLISIFTSFVYFSVSPITAASNELLARTSPTVWDVLIAICGGFAGIIGQTRKEKSNVIPGVAIATALMPPLCTAGYGLARRNWSYFSGALYLFFINGFFICLTAIIVLKFLRVPRFEELTKKQLTKIHRIIAVIAVITMLPSVYFAYDMIRGTLRHSVAESYVENEFTFEGTQIVRKDIDIDEGMISLSLIGKEITQEQIADLEGKLSEYGLGDYTLHITQTKVSEGVTAEEVKAMLDEHHNENDEPDVVEIIYEKENEELHAEIERLNSEIEELRGMVWQQKREDDAKKLCDEIVLTEPKIITAQSAFTDITPSGEILDEEKLYILIVVSEKLDKNERKHISSMVEEKLGIDDFDIIQRVQNDDMSDNVKDTSMDDGGDNGDVENNDSTD